MKKVLKNIFFALLFYSNHVVAQPDTILVGYKLDDVGVTSIQKSTILSDGQISLIQLSSVEGFNLLIVDQEGKIIFENNIEEVAGHSILSYFHLIEEDTKYVLVGNTIRDGKRYFATFSIDKTLETATMIDTFNLIGDVRLYFNEMRFNAHKNLWEAFGVVQNANSITTILDYFYVGIKKDHTFNRLKIFQPTKYFPSHILDFCWVEDANRYLLGCFNAATMLVDDDINITYENTTKVSYLYNGSAATSVLRLYNCLDSDDDIVFCYAKEPWDRLYNAAFARLEVKADTVILVEATPLSDPPLGVQIESIMRKDYAGNYIISGTNALPWSGNNNIVKVVKFSASLDKVWEFSYQSDKGFLIFDMQIDQNNDIFLLGQAWNIFGDGAQRGFLMKVYANGTLTSYEEIPTDPQGKYNMRISPNPAAHNLCLHTSSGEPVQLVRFWNTNGQLVFSAKPTAPLHCFELPSSLPPGIYTVEALFADGYRNVQKLVVAR